MFLPLRILFVPIMICAGMITCLLMTLINAPVALLHRWREREWRANDLARHQQWRANFLQQCAPRR